MSKITEILQKYRQTQVERERQSVAELALELNKSAESFLALLSEAGVAKANDQDLVTSEEKAKLLQHLMKPSEIGPKRKKITLTIDTEKKKLLRRVSNQENGAELEALMNFALDIVWGHRIEPWRQNMVNLIVAKAIYTGALPLKKLGRPNRDELDSIGRDAANRYWEMVDSGLSSQKAVELLSGEFHKSERHIMRLIAPHKKSVGETLEDRDRNRNWMRAMRELYPESHEDDLFGSQYFFDMRLPDLNVNDYLEHLDEMMQKLEVGISPLTKKS